MKKVGIGIGIVIVFILGAGIYYLNGSMPIGSGYTSKYLCSQVFLAGRDPDIVFQRDIIPTNPLFKFFDYKVDYKNKVVTAAGFGKWDPRKSVYREGFGCTLAIDTTREELLREVEGAIPQSKPNPDKIWPDGEFVELYSIPQEVNRSKLKQVIDEAFTEPTHKYTRNTYAVVVVYKGRIVSEQYQKEFSPTTPMAGWSMSKSVTNALVGILLKRGQLIVEEGAPIPAWHKPDDPKRWITLDNLLHMTSGLKFEERYDPFTDVTEMLYNTRNMADFAIAKPLDAEPGEVWSYSSGTAAIIARIVKDRVGGTLVSFNNFARQELFDKIAMHSTIIEPDASGAFVGSSYVFATARDWARLGLLFMNDGVWDGERILAEGWVEYSVTPTPKAPKGEYGAMIWLNSGEKGNSQNRMFPTLPTDLYYFKGFNEQIVAVIPSRDVIVVRLGATHDKSVWDIEKFISDVLSCIES